MNRTNTHTATDLGHPRWRLRYLLARSRQLSNQLGETLREAESIIGKAMDAGPFTQPKPQPKEKSMKVKCLHPMLIAVVVSLSIIGCAVLPQILPPATGVAACIVIQKNPQAAGYVQAAGGVFTALGKQDSPPTAAELANALADIPGANLNQVYAQAIWSGAVLAYTEMWKLAKTPVQIASLGATLSGIGASLTSAAQSCGPSAPNVSVKQVAALQSLTATGIPVLAHPEDVKAIADAIAKDIKNWKSPRK